MSVEEEEEVVPGIGFGVRRRKVDAHHDEEDDRQTEYTTASSASSGVTQLRLYKPRPAKPSLSIAEQAAKYDQEYYASLKKSSGKRSSANHRAQEDLKMWNNGLEDDDDARIEGIYTYDYSINTGTKAGPKSSNEQQRSRTRITEYEDPSRPGIMMKSRKYLPPPTDERSYGVPVGRRTRAFMREREKGEALAAHKTTDQMADAASEPTPNHRKSQRMSQYPQDVPSDAFTRATEYDTTRPTTPIPDHPKRPLAKHSSEAEIPVTPKKSSRNRDAPSSVRSNPGPDQMYPQRHRTEKTLTPDIAMQRRLEYDSKLEPSGDQPDGFKQQVRKMRSEPVIHPETGARPKSKPSDIDTKL